MKNFQKSCVTFTSHRIQTVNVCFTNTIWLHKLNITNLKTFKFFFRIVLIKNSMFLKLM